MMLRNQPGLNSVVFGEFLQFLVAEEEAVKDQTQSARGHE